LVAPLSLHRTEGLTYASRFSCKGRGEKDLEASAATRDFNPSAFRPLALSDFFGVHPKKVPLF